MMLNIYRQCSLCNNKEIFLIKTLSRTKCSKFPAPIDLDAGYVPRDVEGLSNLANYFKPPLNKREPFTLLLPPPNITGTLHLGHALTATIEDVLVRWKRMKGIETMWVPGMDHAGIATQVVVEKNLWNEEGKTRHDIGRKAFEERVWKWKKEKAHIIATQLRRLGVSLDWQRELFTMDKNCSEAVQIAFKRLYDAALIYRADRLTNWSCVLQSAISDIEIEYVTVEGPTKLQVPKYEKPVEFGTMIKFAYKLIDSDEEILVATTRPETILGDVAVAVHPEDQRYTNFVGRQVWHPFRNVPIPIISDKFVDREFGTGVVKITPAHDRDDFEVATRHNLHSIQVITETGHITGICEEFKGLPRFDARSAIVQRLGELGLYRSKSDHRMVVPVCSRSKDVVELLVKPQWFIKCDEMAAKAVEDVRKGRLRIEPSNFEKVWFDWLENIRDWCISRQLWWGHQVPVYHCSIRGRPQEAIWVAAMNEQHAREEAISKLGFGDLEVIRDEDVLDTWFSSALLPMVAFGWPHQTTDLDRHFPLSLMETGHDILFFWVARMVLLGSQLMGKLPFDKILLHGIVCDARGRKMSKSVGNVVAPEHVITGRSLAELEKESRNAFSSGVISKEELARSIQCQKKSFPSGIPECGADSLRFTFVSHNIKNHLVNFNIDECYTNKLFCNKIWQATKFTKLWFAKVQESRPLDEVNVDALSVMDKWILSRLSRMVDVVSDGLENYNFHLATGILKNFLYYDFCDVYLESTKRGLRDSNSALAAGHCFVLSTCLDIGLRCLAPFMPVLAAHLHQSLPFYPGMERTLYYPKKLHWQNDKLDEDIERVMNVVVAIRRLKKMFNITAKHKPEVFLVDEETFWHIYSQIVSDLAGCHKMNILASNDVITDRCTVEDKVGDTVVHLVVPEEMERALELDMPKMEDKKRKLFKDLEKWNDAYKRVTGRANATAEAQADLEKKIASIKDKLRRIEYIKSIARR